MFDDDDFLGKASTIGLRAVAIAVGAGAAPGAVSTTTSSVVG